MRRLLFISIVLTACATTAPTPRPPTPAPRPPAPARSPNALTPIATMPRAIAEPKIRVGLLSDQATVVFPRTSDGYYLVAANGPSILKRGFTATAPKANAVVRYAVQASAISDKESAEQFVEKLKSEMNVRVETVFDPAGGAYHILAGDFESNDAALPLRTQLTDRGYGKDMMIVRRPSDEPFEKKIEIVDDEGDRYTIAGDVLDIFPVTVDTIAIDKKPYRTSARLFVNTRGLLNVINELNLEDYLFGVVPAEMGPTIYDEVEALKAQAVAARTYAVRNLGQYGSEGYDICPGPACQAYNGFGGEADLSTRAVRETAGLILTYNGQPIDALYTATCGGETSDVGTMFPGRSEPYLKRARCVEMEMTTLAGRADSGMLTESQVNARLFAAAVGLPDSGTSWAAGDVQQAVSAAMKAVGLSGAPAASPASSRRGDVLMYLASVLGFDRYAAVVTLPEDRKYFFPQSASDATSYAAAAFLVKFGFLPALEIDRIDLNAAIPREELYGLLGSWLRKHNALNEATGKIFAISGRALTLKAEGKTVPFNLPD